MFPFQCLRPTHFNTTSIFYPNGMSRPCLESVPSRPVCPRHLARGYRSPTPLQWVLLGACWAWTRRGSRILESLETRQEARTHAALACWSRLCAWFVREMSRRDRRAPGVSSVRGQARPLAGTPASSGRGHAPRILSGSAPGCPVCPGYWPDPSRHIVWGEILHGPVCSLSEMARKKSKRKSKCITK